MAKQAKKSVSKSNTKLGIIPLGDRVLIKPLSEEEIRGEKKNNFGIIIPDTVSQDKSGQGKVLSVGEGRYEDGKLIPVKVKPGDMVFFSKYSYDEVSLGDEEFLLLKEDNILAIIK